MEKHRMLEEVGYHSFCTIQVAVVVVVVVKVLFMRVGKLPSASYHHSVSPHPALKCGRAFETHFWCWRFGRQVLSTSTDVSHKVVLPTHCPRKDISKSSPSASELSE